MVGTSVDLINLESDGAIEVGDAERFEAMKIKQVVTGSNAEKLSRSGDIGKLKLFESWGYEDFLHVF